MIQSTSPEVALSPSCHEGPQNLWDMLTVQVMLQPLGLFATGCEKVLFLWLPGSPPSIGSPHGGEHCMLCFACPL